MTELCEQVAAWHEEHSTTPLTVLCQTVAVPRGTFYAWRRRQQAPQEDRRHQAPGRAPWGYSITRTGTKISDGQLMDGIVEILETENAQYGYHKITWRLQRRYQLVMSFKKVYRLLKTMELLWPQRQRQLIWEDLRIIVQGAIDLANWCLASRAWTKALHERPRKRRPQSESMIC